MAMRSPPEGAENISSLVHNSFIIGEAGPALPTGHALLRLFLSSVTWRKGPKGGEGGAKRAKKGRIGAEIFRSNFSRRKRIFNSRDI